MRLALAVLVFASCDRSSSTPPEVTPPAVAPSPPPPAKPRSPDGPHRLTSRHCDRLAMPARPAPTVETTRDALGRDKGPATTGILVDVDPIVLEVEPQKFVKVQHTSVSLANVAIGDLVAATIGRRYYDAGELAADSVLDAIETVSTGQSRPATLIQDTKASDGTLSVLDDGNVLFDGVRVFQLDDGEVSALIQTLADARVQTMPDLAASWKDRMVTVTCRRYHVVDGTVDAMEPVIAALDRLRHRVEAQATYRLQWTQRTKITWIDWPASEPHVAELPAQPTHEVSAALFLRLPFDHVLNRGAVPDVLVRDAGKSYLVQRRHVATAPSPDRFARSLSIEECSETATSCRTLPAELNAKLATAPQPGIAVDRSAFQRFRLPPRGDVARHEILGAIVGGDYLYHQPVLRRTLVTGPERWRLQFHAKLDVRSWPAAAPRLASWIAQRNQVVTEWAKSGGNFVTPLHDPLPEAIAKQVGTSVFDDGGVLYRVTRGKCGGGAQSPCRAGTFFELEVSPIDVRRVDELAKVDLGAELSASFVRDHQRIVEGLEDGRGYIRVGDIVYQYLHAERIP